VPNDENLNPLTDVIGALSGSNGLEEPAYFGFVAAVTGRTKISWSDWGGRFVGSQLRQTKERRHSSIQKGGVS